MTHDDKAIGPSGDMDLGISNVKWGRHDIIYDENETTNNVVKMCRGGKACHQ